MYSKDYKGIYSYLLLCCLFLCIYEICFYFYLQFMRGPDGLVRASK